jgi:hypothetical protein
MKLTSAEVIARLTLAAKRLGGITLSASTSPIKMGVELGNFLIEKFINNTVEALDGVGGVDQLLVDFFKSLSDNPEVAEAIALDYYKYLTHEAEMSDDEIIDFFKNVANTANVGEFYEPHFFKNTENQFLAVDQIDRREFYKTLYNTVNFTDDVDGAASIEDDQEMQFMKYTTHLASVSDLFDREVNFVRYFTEQGVFTDDDYIEFQKALADSVTGIEDHVFIFAKKVKEDTFYVTELAAKDFWRPLSDSYSISDAYSLEPGKVLYDVISGVEDQAFIFSKKVREDTSVATDEINTKDVGLNKADPVSVADPHYYDYGKPLADSYAIASTHSLEPGKVLYDSVSGIGDYVFIFAKKAPDDTFRAIDQINTIGVGKAEEDATSASDQINTKEVSKPVADQSSAADQINTKATSKQLTDSLYATDDVDGAASILDDQEMQFVKGVTHAVGCSDFFEIYKVFYRDFDDPAITADLLSRAFGKAVSHVASTADAMYFAAGKALSDVTSFTDDERLDVTKKLTDSSLITESAVRGFGKSTSDTASSTDAGSLRSQGYADFAYFAEDFVGASRTF